MASSITRRLFGAASLGLAATISNSSKGFVSVLPPAMLCTIAAGWRGGPRERLAETLLPWTAQHAAHLRGYTALPTARRAGGLSNRHPLGPSPLLELEQKAELVADAYAMVLTDGDGGCCVHLLARHPPTIFDLAARSSLI